MVVADASAARTLPSNRKKYIPVFIMAYHIRFLPVISISLGDHNFCILLQLWSAAFHPFDGSCFSNGLSRYFNGSSRCEGGEFTFHFHTISTRLPFEFALLQSYDSVFWLAAEETKFAVMLQKLFQEQRFI